MKTKKKKNLNGFPTEFRGYFYSLTKAKPSGN